MKTQKREESRGKSPEPKKGPAKKQAKETAKPAMGRTERPIAK